jgi:hypothetical protein
MNGFTGYKFGQDLGTSNPHESASDCINCHMHARGNNTGGHTWMAGVEACSGCHGNLPDFDYNGVETEIEELLADLGSALKTAGILDAKGGIVAPPLTRRILLARCGTISWWKRIVVTGSIIRITRRPCWKPR